MRTRWPKAHERLEASVCDELRRAGHDPCSQAKGASGLVANIITRDTIFEVKAYIDRQAMLEAVGHLFLCNSDWKRPKATIIAGGVYYWPEVRTLVENARRQGIRFICWPAWRYDPRFAVDGACEHCAALLFDAAEEKGWRP